MFDFIIEMIADIAAPAIKPILQGKLLLSRLLLRMNGKAALRPATDWYMKSQSLHGRLLTIIATVGCSTTGYDELGQHMFQHLLNAGRTAITRLADKPMVQRDGF